MPPARSPGFAAVACMATGHWRKRFSAGVFSQVALPDERARNRSIKLHERRDPAYSFYPQQLERHRCGQRLIL